MITVFTATLPTGSSADLQGCSCASVLLIGRGMFITTAGLDALLFTNLSGTDGWLLVISPVPPAEPHRYHQCWVQMSDCEIVAVCLSWIVPLRGGSILLLSDERSEKANSYHISGNYGNRTRLADKDLRASCRRLKQVPEHRAASSVSFHLTFLNPGYLWIFFFFNLSHLFIFWCIWFRLILFPHLGLNHICCFISILFEL